jgi:hypothetical protein
MKISFFKNLPCCLFVFLVVYSSKNYLQNAKKGEGVPSRETQVGNNIGPVEITITKGLKSALKKRGIIMRVAMTKKQQWVENNNKWGITIKNYDKHGTTTNEEWPHVNKNNHG